MFQLKTILFFCLLNISALQSSQNNRHIFVCTDYSQGKVFVINEQNGVTWEYPAKNCNDIWVLKNGNLLFNDGNTVKEVNREKQLVWQYQSDSDIYACQRLANGNTFIGECTAGRLIEVNTKGQLVRSITLPEAGEKASTAFMRNARKLDNGHYLVAHYGMDKVCEYDSDGEIVWELPVTGGPHSVVRLPNGNTLVSCSDHHGDAGIIEFNSQKQIVWKVSSNELPGISLKFVAGFQRLANGNTVFTNWLGHNHLGESAQAIEVTHDKKVVWKYDLHDRVKTMSSIFLLDTKGAIGH